MLVVESRTLEKQQVLVVKDTFAVTDNKLDSFGVISLNQTFEAQSLVPFQHIAATIESTGN